MSGSTARVVPNEWIVRLKPYATNDVKSMHMNMISTRTADSTPFNCQVRNEYNLPEARGYSASFDEATKKEIEKQDEVDSVEPVMLFSHCRVVADTSPKVPWGLDRVSHYRKAPKRGPYTYEYNPEAAGQGVIAYVIDTGINDQHVEFEGRASKGPMFVTVPRSAPKQSSEDTQGHGTHCAGTIGSKTYGVAKKVELVGVKVFNDYPDGHPLAGARTDDIIKAIEYVVEQYRETKRPSVINLSLGGGVSPELDAAVASAIRAGVIVCCAAGNGGPNDDKDVDTTSPARSPLALSVAASNIDDQIANFSYFGSLVDIVAPGVDIESTWIGGNDKTMKISGTSMACPHVAGVVATILSNPQTDDKSPFNVLSQLLILADKNAITNPVGETVNAEAHIST